MLLPNPALRTALVLGGVSITVLLLLVPSGYRALSKRWGDKLVIAETWFQGHQIRHPPIWQPPRDEHLISLKAPEQTLNSSRIDGAAFVVLARNKDLWELLGSIRQMEDRFNHKYAYPWIFLNNEPFTDEFKQKTAAFTSGECSYGLIPEEDWPPGYSMPSNINATLATQKINEMGAKPIPYGGSVVYRKMCRYQSGYFWRHPLLDNLQYYWRVEPSVKYYCDLEYDPFRFMLENKKKYAFVVSLYEYPDTITSLWETTKAFLIKHPEHLSQPNLLPFISPDNGLHYNQCHFWSNFEIADLSLWRSQAYRDYFDFLDEAGGFFYERWGDAPIHSIAASLFLKPDEIHFFDDIGYFHPPFHACPVGGTERKCACDPQHPLNFEFHDFSCTPRFKRLTQNVFQPPPPTTETITAGMDAIITITATVTN